MNGSNGSVTRPHEDVVAGFVAILSEYSPSSLVADAQSREGAVAGFDCVAPTNKAAGPVLTLRLEPDELADWPQMMLLAEPGDILLIAAAGQARTALWGGLATTLAMRAGLVGVIVDGAIRDVDEIRDTGFPVWHRGRSPRPSPTFVHGRTDPVAVNVPVVVDDQVIRPGDLLVADECGFTTVRQEVARKTLDQTRLIIERERELRARIDNGMCLEQIIAEFGRI